MTDWKTPFEISPVGKGFKVYDGGENADTAVISIGHIGNMALQAVNGKHVSLYNMPYLKPLDEVLLDKIFGEHKRIITIEDGTLKGGLFSAVSEFAALQKYKGDIIPLGIPDRFITHGAVSELYKECGLTTEKILTLL